MQPADTLYGVVKNGVLTLSSGPGASLKVAQNHLITQDGGTELKFRRAACPVSRVIVVRSEGFVTIPALRWLHEVGAALVVLQYDGTPIAVTVPPVIVPAALRRVQAATTMETPLGKDIAGSLIRAKIAGQVATLRTFDRDSAASEIDIVAERLQHSVDTLELLGAEGMASAVYWRALADIPLQFGKRQAVPDHWRTFGSRTSSLTGAPRGAVLPAQAIWNYCYGVLSSEISISLHAVGLDPALGILHADKDNRASAAYDLMEPARPILDRWLLHWLQSATFSKRDFHEDIYGYIRVTHPLNSHLAMTAALWRGLADELVQWFHARLSGDSTKELRLKHVDIEAEARRRAVRWALGNRIERPIPTTCFGCGKALPARRKFCSDACMQSYHDGAPSEIGLAAINQARTAARAAGIRWTHRKRQHQALSAASWRAEPGWSKDRDTNLILWFTSELAPRLTTVRPVDIRRATGLSTAFSMFIRTGKRVPHPRWFQVLAKLAGVEYPFEC